MYPLNQQGYAPVIRGITGQSAELTIRQQGMTIRRETLPAGEFVIDDLNTSFQGTELDVTIEEADGTVQRFTQHGTSVPVMQRRAGSATRWIQENTEETEIITKTCL